MQRILGEADLFCGPTGIGDLAILRHDLGDEDEVCLPYPGTDEGVGKCKAHTLHAFSQ